MKILWICNILLRDFAKELNQKGYYGGGWMEALSKDIAKDEKNKLVICSPCNLKDSVKKNIGNITYYSFNPKYVKEQIRKVYDIEKPDIIHIHGTEYTYGFDIFNELPNANYVVSIQGLVSLCAIHYYSNVPNSIINKKTLAQLVINDSIKLQKKDFEKRGFYEKQLISKVNNVIGRTRWDRACVYNINKNAKYFYCGESLRDAFYDRKWNINDIERYSIFISQATYPIKGFHMFLEAYKDIVKEFPNSKVYVAGKDITASKTIEERLKKRYYDKYIMKKIKEYNLQNNIIFLGILDENQMAETMVKSHIVVSSSAIENSPNSVGEAMLMGIPVIASNVGGVSDIIDDSINGILYPFNEYYMLKYYIESIFKDDELAKRLSNNAKEKAKILYDREKNKNDLLNIYRQIINGNRGE